MPDLIWCELKKIKRQRFLVFVALAACLFPAPVAVVILGSKATNGAFATVLTVLMTWIGIPLMVPAITGIFSSILFNMERDHNTLINLYVIPIEWSKLVCAKIFVVFVFSILFTFTTFLSAATAAVLVGGSIERIGIKLVASLLVGIFYTSATLPAVFLIVLFNRGILLSTLLSVIYAVIQDIFVWSGISAIHSAGGYLENLDLSTPQLWSFPMMIFRWFPYFIDSGNASGSFGVSIWQLVIMSVIIAAVSILFIFRIGKQRKA